MRRIVYYVAVSIDGFIAGRDGDISAFEPQGKSTGVKKYLRDLEDFDTVIMGRKTYEFGYRFGMEPGQPAYPHMAHYIFSNSLQFESPNEKVHVEKLEITRIGELQRQQGADIYLCGGGDFAGWLLENNRIDILKIKLNPIILGTGIRLFGSSKKNCQLTLQKNEKFDYGLQIITYSIHT